MPLLVLSTIYVFFAMLFVAFGAACTLLPVWGPLIGAIAIAWLLRKWELITDKVTLLTLFPAFMLGVYVTNSMVWGNASLREMMLLAGVSACACLLLSFSKWRPIQA